jgi:hypothetical protein
VADTNPYVIRSEPTRSALLKSRPMPGADSATVFLDKRGRLFGLDRPLTPGEVAWDTPRAVFEVDISVHSLTFDLQLPAVEKAFSFQARIVVHWRIADAKAAVEAKLSNPDLVVTSSVEQRLREVSREFAIEDSTAAENAIRAHLSAMPVPLSQGIALVECVVSLSLDRSTESHVASRTHALRQRETLKSIHETTQLNTLLAIEQGTAQQMLETQQATFAQQMAAQAEKHKLEIEQMNMQFYSQALSEGNLNLIALRLSTNRDDVNDVINLFMRQRQLDYEGARGMLDSLLENRLVNKRDVADIMARATSVVADHMTRAPFDLAGIEGHQPTALSAAAVRTGTPAATPEPPAPDRKSYEDDDAFDNDFDDDLDDE